MILAFRMHDGVPKSEAWRKQLHTGFCLAKAVTPSLYSTFVSSKPNWNKVCTFWSAQKKQCYRRKLFAQGGYFLSLYMSNRQTCFIHNVSAGQTFFCQLEAVSTPPGSLLLTIHALPWCNRSPSKLVTISQKFFSRKYCWNNNTALPWELKDNCMSLWHCCFISFMLHFWFPPESCFFHSFAHIYFWHLI